MFLFLLLEKDSCWSEAFFKLLTALEERADVVRSTETLQSEPEELPWVAVQRASGQPGSTGQVTVFQP